MEPDYDVLIIGSGFGGSVSALRLTEKATRSAFWRPAGDLRPRVRQDLARRLREFLWAPRLGCYGIQRIHLLRNVMILAMAPASAADH